MQIAKILPCPIDSFRCVLCVFFFLLCLSVWLVAFTSGTTLINSLMVCVISKLFSLVTKGNSLERLHIVKTTRHINHQYHDSVAELAPMFFGSLVGRAGISVDLIASLKRWVGCYSSMSSRWLDCW